LGLGQSHSLEWIDAVGSQREAKGGETIGRWVDILCRVEWLPFVPLKVEVDQLIAVWAREFVFIRFRYRDLLERKDLLVLNSFEMIVDETTR
jgi:hypothetical protein